ncbi:MAG: D-alanyl-D-alanine carboxypeptidase family protein [Clostridia bacterium]|nr:D-alanyl-D-alanine carboxypeptidase family protein [Clostridia bacterium]
MNTNNNRYNPNQTARQSNNSRNGASLASNTGRKPSPEQIRARKAAEKEELRRAKIQEKLRRHDERFELTPEEVAIRDQMKKEEREYRSHQRTKKLKAYAGRFLVFLIMFVVLAAAAAGLFYWNLHHSQISEERGYTLTVGKTSYHLDFEQAMRNGHLYVKMSPIVDLCEMATTGDTTALRYITDTTRENVRFQVGSTQIFINGTEERLSAAPFFESGDLWIPYDFLTDFVVGLETSYSPQSNTIVVKRTVNSRTGSYNDVSFSISSSAPMLALNEYDEFGDTSPVDFVADLSIYESFMNPADRDAYLILVNEQYPLDRNYIPNTVEISDIRYDGRPPQYLCNTAEKAAHAMVMEARTNGYADLSILLGYRSFSKQNLVFSNLVDSYLKTMSEEQADLAAAKEVQRPGCNPQQAGYSIVLHDILTEDAATLAFAKTPCYSWLAQNCWKFGFILRYPSGKTEQTGMPYQPCFFTFVGRYHALRITESGLCLEEYVQMLEDKGYFDGMTYEEFYHTIMG